MEAWGRGIPDIFNECKAVGLPAPEFESIPNFVCLTNRFKNPLTPYFTGEGNDDRLNDELNPSVRSTYLIVKENPGIQRKELSEKTGKSIPTIDRHLAELQEKRIYRARRLTENRRIPHKIAASIIPSLPSVPRADGSFFILSKNRYICLCNLHRKRIVDIQHSICYLFGCFRNLGNFRTPKPNKSVNVCALAWTRLIHLGGLPRASEAWVRNDPRLFWP